VAQKVQDALIPYLALVVGLAIVLLLLVFRSLLVPLKAALGFLLSVLAALGAVVAVFQQGHGASLLGVDQTGPIMSLMPIFLVGIVFGLAMDYEVFLVSRMREAYVHGDGPGEAIVSGFRHSARVVVAAALIMMAVFSGFIGAGASMIKMIGFGLAIAVLFDAFVVRMAIVPAVLSLLGNKAWYLPSWLDRILPRMDVEGEALSRKVPAPTADTPTAPPHPGPVGTPQTGAAESGGGLAVPDPVGTGTGASPGPGDGALPPPVAGPADVHTSPSHQLTTPSTKSPAHRSINSPIREGTSMKTSVQAGVAGLLACGTLLTVVLVTRDGDGTTTATPVSPTRPRRRARTWPSATPTPPGPG
jgi:hypothetical protein